MFAVCIIIAIPLYFIFRWLFRKFVKHAQLRIWLTCLTTVTATILIYPLLIMVFFSMLMYEPKRSFDVFRWKAIPEKRYEMADDIVNTKILIGKDSTEVKLMLGNEHTNNYGETKVIWTFDLGTGGCGFGWMFHSLQITFYENVVKDVVHYEYCD